MAGPVGDMGPKGMVQILYECRHHLHASLINIV